MGTLWLWQVSFMHEAGLVAAPAALQANLPSCMQAGAASRTCCRALVPTRVAYKVVIVVTVALPLAFLISLQEGRCGVSAQVVGLAGLLVMQ